ncbi:MAG: 1,4-dihydroxy-2-naphthoate polyprenyltransferase [Dehalococcoidia bacterium]
MTAAAATAPGKATAWKMAVRLPTLTAAVAPVVVGSAAAYHDDAFAAGPAAAALIGALALQVGANFANDVFDFERGADTADRLGPPRATALGLLTPAQMKLGMWLAFAAGTLCGLYLTYEAGWVIVAVGLASIAGAIVYTGGPWPVGYHALGDLFTFVFFGLVAVIGTYFVQAKEVTGFAVLASLPVACTVTCILVVNNLRDIETDRRAGKTTLGVIMGDRGTRWWYGALLFDAWAAMAVGIIAGAPWAALALVVAVPLGVRLYQPILGGTTGRELNPILKATARYHLLLGLLWAAAIAVG